MGYCSRCGEISIGGKCRKCGGRAVGEYRHDTSMFIHTDPPY
jgi:hypothetical protein